MTSEERALKFLTMTDSDERVIQLTRLLDQHAEEQRQECADKVHDCLHNYGIRQDAIYDASEACLDATGESDEIE